MKRKDFELFTQNLCFTDDAILTCATAEWLLTGDKPEPILKKWGEKYQNRSYEKGQIPPLGKGFTNWLKTGIPYQAKTNGCVMRISPIGLKEKQLEVALKKALQLTNMTHNHPLTLV